VCVTRSGPGQPMKAAVLPAALRDRFEVAEHVAS
jgi:hypothetical protein